MKSWEADAGNCILVAINRVDFIVAIVVLEFILSEQIDYTTIVGSTI
jgi:hypothetical protein